MRKYVKNGFNYEHTADAIKVCLCYVLGCSCGAVGGGFPRRYLAWLSPHTRIGRVPISYPTTSTRRLMNPTADARTGRKAYADCRRDCRNTGINIQRDQQEVNTRAILRRLSIRDFCEGLRLPKFHGATLGFYFSIISQWPFLRAPTLRMRPSS